MQTLFTVRHTPSVICWVLVLFFVPCEVHSAAAEDEFIETKQRPRIGLALGGGVARGGVHVGNFKRLEELRIPIDHIAGTSTGSIVGGLCVSGFSPDFMGQTIATTYYFVLGQPHRLALLH